MVKFRGLVVICLILMLFFDQVPAQTDTEIKMVFLGASNTNTEEWSNGSYVTKLKDYGQPWTELQITNSGVDGVGVNTYYNQSVLLGNKLQNYENDIYFIMLGGNDLLDFESTESFETKFMWLVSTINNNTDNSLIFVANIIWSPLAMVLSETVLGERYQQFQSIIENETRRFNFNFVDVYNVTENQNDYFQDDFIHLNEAGHRAVSRSIHNQTKQQIEEAFGFSEELDRTNSLIIGVFAVILLVLGAIFLKKYSEQSQ